MTATSNKEIVKKMWHALSEMDWDTMKSCMHPEIHYRDVPSDDPGAFGPENCVKRLQIAFKHLKKQDQVTHHIAADIDDERNRMMEKLQKLAVTDGLTGLFNSRHFFTQLELEVDRSNRYKHPLALLLIDIDSIPELISVIVASTLAMLVFAAITMNWFRVKCRLWELALLAIACVLLFRRGIVGEIANIFRVKL